jgi:CBS domain containing-hemolysin-like protein
VSAALRSLSFQLSGAQLGITLTALLTGYLAEPAIAPLLRPGLATFGAQAGASLIALVIATLISMLFGELVPKNVAIARPMPTARWSAPGQRIFSMTFAWLIHMLNGSANWVVRRLGVEPQEELASARSPEELGLLAAISARAGALPRETALLLQRTIRFGDKRAAEAMTPRVDLVALPAYATVADLLAASLESGHSRFPVYEQTLDQIVGIATVAAGFSVPPANRASTPVRTVATEPVYVPEHLDLDSLLDVLRRSDTALAVVVDEYGGTDGVVTIEDLVEELVGEIADEHDESEQPEPLLVTVPGADPARFVPGVLREDEVAEQTGFRMPEGPYETLAGFLMARLGHIPAKGEKLTYQDWEFTVTDVERHRVEQVRVRPPEDWHPAGELFAADEPPHLAPRSNAPPDQGAP